MIISMKNRLHLLLCIKRRRNEDAYTGKLDYDELMNAELKLINCFRKGCQMSM